MTIRVKTTTIARMIRFGNAKKRAKLAMMHAVKKTDRNQALVEIAFNHGGGLILF
jgi:hypothetical protein